MSNRLKRAILVAAAFTMICACGQQQTVTVDENGLAPLLAEGMTGLGITAGDAALCVITNASYAIRDGQTTERDIDIIASATGCTIGKGNLLLFHRPSTVPVKIAMYNRSSHECTVIDTDGAAPTLRGPVSLAFERVNDETAWGEIEDTLGASDAFTITTVAHQWAAGAPFDFLKCAELHNHLCPGVTSGYFIAKYIQKFHPLETGESYTYLSCPPWCKDDAIQMLLDLTPGKRSIFVKELSDEQLERVADPDVAGIMLLRHGGTDTVTAIVLSFDWDAAAEASGSQGFSGMQSTLTTITGLIPFYGEPERFVNVPATYELTADAADRLLFAGVNPYEELGFIKE